MCFKGLRRFSLPVTSERQKRLPALGLDSDALPAFLMAYLGTCTRQAPEKGQRVLYHEKAEGTLKKDSRTKVLVTQDGAGIHSTSHPSPAPQPVTLPVPGYTAPVIPLSVWGFCMLSPNRKTDRWMEQWRDGWII